MSAAASLTTSSRSDGDRVDDQIDVAGRRLRNPRLLRQGPWALGEIQDRRCDVNRPDPVDHRMMRLVDQRNAAILQALDNVQLPQRPGPIERPGDQPADHVLQLGRSSGFRQRRPSNVVRQVEIRVVHPHRPRQPTRNETDPLPVTRHQGQPSGDEVDQVLVVERARGRLQDHHAPDVHRCGLVLGVEERGVGRRKAVGHASW